jgi:hypothetical protein
VLGVYSNLLDGWVTGLGASSALAEANRLWWKGRDLRESKVPTGGSIPPVGLDDVVTAELDQLGIDSLGPA